MSERASPASIEVPWGSSTVRVVLLSTLLMPLSVALISPTLPVFRDAFGLTDARASLLLAAILFPGIVLSPLVGFLTDRAGRRRVLVGSLLLWSLAGCLVVLEPPFWVILALRSVQGTALAGVGVTTVTLIGDTFDHSRRNAVLGVNTAVLSAGAAVYPLVGGALALVAWNAPFVAYFLGIPAALYAVMVLEEPAGERERRSGTYLRRMVAALSAREAALLYGSALAIDLLVFGAVFTALPFLLEDDFGLSPVLIGLIVTAEAVGSTAAATQNARLAGFLSDGRIITLGFAAIAVGFGGAWAASTPTPIALATFVFGAGWGVTLPSIDAGISDIVPARYRGGALSFRSSASSLGRAAGPVLFATLGARSGYRSLFLLAGVAALSLGLVLFAGTRSIGDT